MGFHLYMYHIEVIVVVFELTRYKVPLYSRMVVK